MTYWFINRKALYLCVLLFISNITSANSSQNIFLMTLSILSYAKWSSNTPQLCIIDNQNYANQFANYIKNSRSPFIISAINAVDLKSKHCDAVFFSNTTPQSEQLLIDKSLNPAILSFSANNTECELGSSFCLLTNKSGRTYFKVNLDSLTQSKIHVDPRVLLLAKSSD